MDDKPWINSYPSGTRWDIEIKPMPVPQIIEESAEKWPENTALRFMGRRISYRELDDLSSRFAKGLQQLGVKPGVHVGLFLPNSPHYPVAFFGVLKAGGVVVNYSPLDAAKVLEHKVGDSETDFLVTLDLVSVYPQMAEMLGKTRLKKLIVGNLGEMSASPEQTTEQLRAEKQLVDLPENEQTVPFARILDNDGQYERYPVTDPADTIAVLQYTGGTTGLPKGAMLTHGNLTAAVEQCMETANPTPPILFPGQEKMLAVLPPFHIYALTVNMLFGLRMGAEVIQMLRFSPKEALAEISENKVTMFCGVPTMFTALITDPDTPTHDLSSLKFCNSGGAPLPVELGKRFNALTGSWLCEGWGMTETSPTGTYTPMVGKRKAGSCGIPSPDISIRMLDLYDSTKYVPIGEKGEMCIKGPNVMKGYWKNPEATAENTTFDGYFRTGDVGYMDEEGFIFIVDRTKDMLLCSGFNVYPRVLEEAIYQHPSVREVAVIGIEDEYRGQSPKAFVALEPGKEPFTIKELQAFLKDKLGKHEMVQALEIRDELPKTAVGKLSKKDLYDEEAKKKQPS